MRQPADDTGKIARSAGTVSAAIMCSRILGLVREQAFAILFGAGYAFDAFVVAFRIPNLLRDLFGEGALSSAFVTVFTDYDTNKGPEKTWRLANTVLIFFGILLSLITLLGCFFAEDIVFMLVEEDFESIPNKVALTSLLTIIMFPFLIFISLAAVVMGILNSKGRFFIPAMASSFFNLGSIIGGVGLSFLVPRFGLPSIVGMAMGTLIGGFLQLGCQLPSLLNAGFRFQLRPDFFDPGLRRILRLMGPAVVGLSATQLNIFINTYFASSCPEGSLSWLNYAFRLVQLPIGVFGVALSIATLPVLAKWAAKKDLGRLRETLVSSLTMGFCLTIPASVGPYLSELIIRLIFQHGNFDALDTAMTAQALSFYALGLFAYAGVKIIVPVFYTLDDTRYPVIGSFLSVALNVLVITLTIDSLGHKAMALSISCAMIGNFLFLSVVLYWKLHGYSIKYLAKGLYKILAAAACMGLLLHLGVGRFLYFFESGFLLMCLSLLVVIVVSAAFYGTLLYLFRLDEFRFLVNKVRDRLSGQAVRE